MNRKKQNKTFIMNSDWKQPFGFRGLYKNILAL